MAPVNNGKGAKNGRLSVTETRTLERIIDHGLLMEGVSQVASKIIDPTEAGANKQYGRIIERLIQEHKIEYKKDKKDKEKKEIKKKKVTAKRKLTKKKTVSKRGTGTKGGRKQNTKKTLKDKLKSPSKITIFFD